MVTLTNIVLGHLISSWANFQVSVACKWCNSLQESVLTVNKNYPKLMEAGPGETTS